MKIDNIEQAEAVLKTYIPAVSKTGDGQSLERMWPLLQRVGNPHEKLKVIHVAGTSGKTSTSYYLRELLHSSGKKVGLTVSPHVDSITERVQIGLEPITDEQFCSDLSEFLSLVAGHDDVSYFELLVIFVLWEFVRYGVDYAVLETGMGGLLDGSNVVTQIDKVCVITDIGYDHMQILGNTLAEIGTQKAGIIQEGNVVFSHTQAKEAQTAIEKRAHEKDADVTFLKAADISNYSNLESYQRRNFALAKLSADYVASRDGFKIAEINPSLIAIPGRMEVRTLKDGSKFVMDGAHNQQKMARFVESFQNLYSEERSTVLLSLKEGKELEEVIKELKPITSRLIVTAFTAYQDVPFKAQKPEAIALYARGLGVETVVVQDYDKALEALLASKGIKVVTGSFYLLGQIRKLL